MEWYEIIDYDQAKNFIATSIKDIARSFVKIGYYLKYIKEKELYKEDGYQDIWEFAFDTYGISRSTASRYIAINDRFSEHGNSPVLAAAYQDYSKSKLQEMLYLTDEQIENVTPEMTVKEIREVRETEQCIETEPAKCITGKSSSGFCGAAAYCDEPVQCCVACKKDCNIRCGWLEECATSHKNIVANETTAKQDNQFCEEGSSRYLVSHEEIIPAAEIEGQVKISDYEGIIPEGMTIICKEREEEEITPQSVLKEETEKLNEWLSAFEGEEHPPFVIRQKIIVEALNKTVITQPEQPEFPILKNNEQRKQWLNNYKEWGLWYEDSNTGASFYKYDFKNGARLIAETYRFKNEFEPDCFHNEFESCYFHLVGGPEPPRTKYGCGKWTRHEIYNRNADNITELVEFLKVAQNI